MTDDSAARNPLGQAIDLCVMAPLGFASEARTLVPELVAKGRGQVATARVVGRFALDQAGGLLSQAGASAAGAAAQAPSRALGALCALRGRPSADADAEPEAPPPAAGPLGVVPTEPAEPAGDAADLAIPDYDSLSASQVVPRLESLEGGELEAVRRYEAGTRARRTILSRIDQLQNPPS